MNGLNHPVKGRVSEGIEQNQTVIQLNGARGDTVDSKIRQIQSEKTATAGKLKVTKSILEKTD